VASRRELERFYQHVAHGAGDAPALLQGWRREAVGDLLRSFLEGNSSLAMAWEGGMLRAGVAV